MILSEPDLSRWGRRIGEAVQVPVFVGLRGALGTGKSVLARAIARGAGVVGPIPSPTFNLVFRYPAVGGVQVVHMDLYRIQAPEEVWELGWEELGKGPEIVLVEWPERAGDLLPGDRWEVEMTIPAGARDHRQVQVARVGAPSHLPGYPMIVSSPSGCE